jgi:hypothetical protein
MLQAEGLDLGLPALLARLHVLARSFGESPQRFVEFGRIALEQAMRSNRRDQIESVCQLIVRTLEHANHHQYQSMSRDLDYFRDIFEPRFAVELAMHDPRSAGVIFGLGRRLHDSEWVFEFTRLFLEMLLERRQLLEWSERNPEGSLAYLQILRKLFGGRSLKEFIGRRMPREEIFDRFFHPRQLRELSERNPEGALAYLQNLRELVGGHLFQEFIEQRMPPEEIFDRFFHLRQLLELSERNPEGALAYLQILRDLVGGRLFQEFIERRMPRVEIFDRFFHPRQLLELSERNPEGALAYLQILRELGFGRSFQEFMRMRSDEYFDRTSNLHQLVIRAPRSVASLAVLLAIARLFDSKQLVETLVSTINQRIQSGNLTDSQMSLLPISVLSDLRWLAELTREPELLGLVASLQN